ncbi:putative membrane channel-forming protein YqfA (hemolysin III family) [Kribbella shirazensis]|uniref:Putative membrane channel-forming protein YqfA (Hemolysin III family) n=1 Tax=Kribbella shirazensis TaxID=1105143 RepID=A0A7X5V9D2_9ACTN|nr:putative membrane channel-forming protein YqfA (hemolysin III family) [Kribbella shirazensis]
MRKNWPSWTGYATALWSLVYGVLGLYWSFGGSGYPFAPVPEDRASASILEGTPYRVVAPVMATIGLGGAVLALVMTRRKPRGRVLQAIAAVLAVGLAVVIPDYTLIAVVAMAPALVVFAFTGVPGEQGGVGDILYWHRVNLIVLFVGGVLWAATAIAYHRRSRDACVSCGRGASERAWTSPDSALRWGKRAVAVAVVANLPYEFTRIAWYFGWPVGITDEFHRMMADTPGMLEMGLGLAVMGLGGSVLTHGLVRPWSEVYPRWIWFRAGRRIPPYLAIVPASIVSVVLIPAGLMNLRGPLGGDMWAANGPGVLWTVWGTALGVATYAYYLRRRTTCSRCGRGVTSRSDVPVGHSSGSRGGSRRDGSPARGLRRSRTRSGRSATTGSRRGAAHPTSG